MIDYSPDNRPVIRCSIRNSNSEGSEGSEDSGRGGDKFIEDGKFKPNDEHSSSSN